MPEGKDEIGEIVKAIIQMKVIEGLNGAPEVVEKLVQAALSGKVDDTGKLTSYGGRSFLDWMVGNEIREAAQKAAGKVILEYVPMIEGEVRKALAKADVADAVVSGFVGAARSQWGIRVIFEPKARS